MAGVSGVSAVASPGDVAIFGEDDYSCALLAAKAVKCWGDNHYGQLGSNGAPSKHMAVFVTGL